MGNIRGELGKRDIKGNSTLKEGIMIKEKLTKIQTELKAPKNQFNSLENINTEILKISAKL